MLLRTLLLLMTLLFLRPIATYACPGCNALNGDLGFGFNASILFMMAMPFTVVACVAAGIVLLKRKSSQIPSAHKHENQIAKETGN